MNMLKNNSNHAIFNVYEELSFSRDCKSSKQDVSSDTSCFLSKSFVVFYLFLYEPFFVEIWIFNLSDT